MDMSHGAWPEHWASYFTKRGDGGDAEGALARSSATYSRSLTMFSALRRLELLGDGKALELHVVGADMREGNTVDATIAIFEPLCELLARAGCTKVQLLLCGPNLGRHLLGIEHVREVHGVRLAVKYRGGLYHDKREGTEVVELAKPDAAFCFNAGVWGYVDWVPTLEFLVGELRVPVVVTAYNASEAEEDAEVFADMDVAFAVAWTAEENPFRSHHVSESVAVPGLLKAENSWWQCIDGRTSSL